jgi:hypothetical protein
LNKELSDFDKHAFVYCSRSRGELPSVPIGMARDYYGAQCPLILTDDGTFCGLSVTAINALLAVSPSRPNCLVNANSAVSSAVIRSICYGTFARMAHSHNRVGFSIHGQSNLLRLWEALMRLNYPRRIASSGFRRYFPREYAALRGSLSFPR